MGDLFQARENRDDGNLDNLEPENLSQEEENQLPEFVDRSEYESLQTQNQQLQRRMEVLAQNMMTPDYINYLEQKRMASYQQQFPQTQTKPQIEEKDDFDPETASQKELVEYITKKVTSMVDNRVNEVDTKVKNQEYQSQLQRANQEVLEAQRKYPDFLTYRPQMVEIAKKYPTISAEEAYLLAKASVGGGGKVQPVNSQTKPQTQPRRPASGAQRPGGVATNSTRQKEDFSSYDEAIESVMKKLGF